MSFSTMDEKNMDTSNYQTEIDPPYVFNPQRDLKSSYISKIQKISQSHTSSGPSYQSTNNLVERKQMNTSSNSEAQVQDNVTLEKVYKKALKEMGIRTTSWFKPNLNIKRPFAQNNKEKPINLNSSTDSLDDWSKPKKTIKKTKTSTQEQNEIPTVNRFKPISLETNSQEEDL